MEARPPGGRATAEPVRERDRRCRAHLAGPITSITATMTISLSGSACTFKFFHVAGRKRSRGLVWVLNPHSPDDALISATVAAIQI
jgi:hypothetical protein